MATKDTANGEREVATSEPEATQLSPNSSTNEQIQREGGETSIYNDVQPVNGGNTPTHNPDSILNQKDLLKADDEEAPQKEHNFHTEPHEQEQQSIPVVDTPSRVNEANKLPPMEVSDGEKATEIQLTHEEPTALEDQNPTELQPPNEEATEVHSPNEEGIESQPLNEEDNETQLPDEKTVETLLTEEVEHLPDQKAAEVTPPEEDKTTEGTPLPGGRGTGSQSSGAASSSEESYETAGEDASSEGGDSVESEGGESESGDEVVTRKRRLGNEENIKENKVAETDETATEPLAATGGGEVESGEEGDQEDSGWEEKAKKDDKEEEKKGPMYVPRKGVFFQHDDRLVADGDEGAEDGGKDTEVQEVARTRADIERWDHDLFVETKQSPREDWEKKQSERRYASRSGQSRERGGRQGDSNLGSYLPKFEGQRGSGNRRNGGRTYRYNNDRTQSSNSSSRNTDRFDRSPKQQRYDDHSDNKDDNGDRQKEYSEERQSYPRRDDSTGNQWSSGRQQTDRRRRQDSWGDNEDNGDGDKRKEYLEEKQSYDRRDTTSTGGNQRSRGQRGHRQLAARRRRQDSWSNDHGSDSNDGGNEGEQQQQLEHRRERQTWDRDSHQRRSGGQQRFSERNRESAGQRRTGGDDDRRRSGGSTFDNRRSFGGGDRIATSGQATNQKSNKRDYKFITGEEEWPSLPVQQQAPVKKESNEVDSTPTKDNDRTTEQTETEDKIVSMVFTARGSRPLSIEEDAGMARGKTIGSGSIQKTLFSTGTGKGKANRKSVPRGAVRSSETQDPQSQRVKSVGRGWREKFKSSNKPGGGGDITIIEPLETRLQKQGIEVKQFDDAENQNTSAASQLPCRGVSPNTTTANNQTTTTPPPVNPPEESSSSVQTVPPQQASAVDISNKQDTSSSSPVASSVPRVADEAAQDDDEGEGNTPQPQVAKPKRYSSRRGRAFETEGAVTVEQVERESMVGGVEGRGANFPQQGAAMGGYMPPQDLMKQQQQQMAITPEHQQMLVSQAYMQFYQQQYMWLQQQMYQQQQSMMAGGMQAPPGGMQGAGGPPGGMQGAAGPPPSDGSGGVEGAAYPMNPAMMQMPLQVPPGELRDGEGVQSSQQQQPQPPSYGYPSGLFVPPTPPTAPDQQRQLQTAPKPRSQAIPIVPPKEPK